MDKKELKEKSGLENFDEFDKYFEISSIEESKFLLREIRRKIKDKMEAVVCGLNSLIYPDSSDIMQMNDANAAGNPDTIFEIIRVFSILLKEHQVLEIEPNDKGDREFCINALETYKNKIAEIKDIISKTKESYESKVKITDTVHYLG
jgi:hypothetical protein